MEKQNEEIKTGKYSPENRGNYLKLLKKEPVYGPINSRRLGLSLGINPIQGGFACNWSCVYCQYGLDDLDEMVKGERKIRFTELSEIQSNLEKRLKSNEHYDSITICGPTEPTLHPRFNEIVNVTIETRNQYRPEIPTSLFTNATRLIGTNTHSLDYVFMKLDAGNEETFQKFNRPRGITLDKIIEQIRGADVQRKIIQTMVCKGGDGNYDNKNIEDYINILKEIKPEEVHLYSLLYAPFLNVDVSPISREELNNLAEEVESRVQTKAIAFIDPVKEGEIFKY